jgi:hypothetical protein
MFDSFATTTSHVRLVIHEHSKAPFTWQDAVRQHRVQDAERGMLRVVILGSKLQKVIAALIGWTGRERNTKQSAPHPRLFREGETRPLHTGNKIPETAK